MKYFLLLPFILFCSAADAQDISGPGDGALKLWYDKPASDWMTEALPIGNGYMGVMFFGQPREEELQFSDGSLWAGGPGADTAYHFGLRKNAYKALPEVRALLSEGKPEEAHKLAKSTLTGIIHIADSKLDFGDFGAQQTMGALYVTPGHKGTVSDYHRELDLGRASGKVSYRVGEVSYERLFFGNYPKKVMVYHFSASKPETYTIRYEGPHRKEYEHFRDGVYMFGGSLHDNGQEFETAFRINTDGEVSFREGKLLIRDATRLTLIHTAATDYLPRFPDYKGKDYRQANRQVLAAAGIGTVEELLKEHLEDYQNLFGRVSLTMSGNPGTDIPGNSSLPTDQRQKAYSEGAPDPGLEALYFQYGRYLMISSSRPGTLPMHLQGKWNHSVNPPWACDYHMNINEQMLYWPAEVAGLPECHLPLFDYMQSLTEPGRLAAREFFDARGWIVNIMNNAYGYTSPGWDFPWGFFPGGAGWLCQHLWEHFAFTQDTVFLRETAYPLMKEAALFWIDYLVEDENGHLVSMPSYSPEHGGISTGASMDHQIAWDLLNNCVTAARVLKTDAAFREKAAAVRDRILPPQIGRWGQLQEWKEDLDDPENHHRHLSHLFALYPGKQIDITKTPELAESAKVSLNARGDSGTGWSLAWKVSFWARLGDGDRAYSLFRRILRPTEAQIVNMSDGGGSYSNLLCAHPPFQLDGNMGSVAGIAEMLLQSHAGAVELLPSLPRAWPDGEVKGLRARGGYTVDIAWKEGRLTSVEIHAENKGSCILKYKGRTVRLTFESGGSHKLSSADL